MITLKIVEGSDGLIYITAHCQTKDDIVALERCIARSDPHFWRIAPHDNGIVRYRAESMAVARDIQAGVDAHNSGGREAIMPAIARRPLK